MTLIYLLSAGASQPWLLYTGGWYLGGDLVVIGYQFLASVRSPLDEWDVPGPFRPVINNADLLSLYIEEVYKVMVYVDI